MPYAEVKVMSNDNEQLNRISPANKSPIKKPPITYYDTQIEVEPANDTASENIPPSKVNTNIQSIISDIENSKKINDILLEECDPKDIPSDLSSSSSMNQTANTLKNINAIKEELCKLPLNTCEKEYILNNVSPLLTVLVQLSATSLNLSSSTAVLTNSPIVHPKRSELEDTIHMIYNINEKCDDVYKILKKRLKAILDDCD